MKNIVVLGSTGSVGRNTCDVVYSHKDEFRIIGLVAGTNLEVLIRQINKFNPEQVSVKNEKDAKYLKELFPKKMIAFGDAGLLEVISGANTQYIVAAINGIDALEGLIHAIRLKKRICLANKECLVVAGKLLNKEIEKYKSEIIPVDSEQSAIFQCLKGTPISEVNKITLTASGGPFFRREKKDFVSITLKEALSHPIWKMGKKITIDSATLMNKALEIIETHFLFHISSEKIEVVIHPQSIIHSMVEFLDLSILAQLSTPDMRIPILFSLAYPKRMKNQLYQISSLSITNLEFFAVDREKYPSVSLAYFVLKEGKNSGAVFNTANEVAVDFFLKNRLSFAQIFNLVDTIMNETNFYEVETLDDIYETIKETRNKSIEWIKGEIGSW